MEKQYITIGLHDGHLEMQVLVGTRNNKKEAESIAKSSRYHIAYLDKEKLKFKNKNLVIRKEQTDQYQFRICLDESKTHVTDDDYKDISWDEAIQFLINDRNGNISFPFSLESYYYSILEYNPVADFQKEKR